MTPAEIKERAEQFSGWYHSIALTPEYTTKSYHEISYQWDMVRAVRDKWLTYQGKKVLDVGTMDGMWAFEAEQLGAAHVLTIDSGQGGQETQERFAFARSVLNSKVSALLADVQEIPASCCYDVIQFLGVLYHLEDPIRALRNLRRAVSPGGLMLLETAVWKDPGAPMARFNSDLGVYDDTSTFWVPNSACLLDWLKMTGWRPDLQTRRSVQATNSERHCMVCFPSNSIFAALPPEPYHP